MSSWDIYYGQIIGKIGGALSCAGSAYILHDVLRDPGKRTKSIYYRIMLGLSAMDMLISFFVWFIGSWAMPQGSWWIWTAGNIFTCDIAGFVGLIGDLGSPLYNCSLATHFLLLLKYNWSDRRMKAIEKWLHIVPWSVSLVFAITSLATKMSGPAAGFCSISNPYPWGCKEPGSGEECVRGIYNANIFWSIYFLLVLASMIYVPVIMFVVYRHVRGLERNSQKFNFVARFQTPDEKKTMKRSRRLMIQGILYSAAMVLLYLFSTIYFISYYISKRESLILRLIWFTLLPLQGVFNVLIYLVPVFRKMLKTYRQGKVDEQEKRKINGIHKPLAESPSKEKLNIETDGNVEEEEEEKEEIDFSTTRLPPRI